MKHKKKEELNIHTRKVSDCSIPTAKRVLAGQTTRCLPDLVRLHRQRQLSHTVVSFATLVGASGTTHERQQVRVDSRRQLTIARQLQESSSRGRVNSQLD